MLEEMRQAPYNRSNYEFKHRYSRSGFSGRAILPTPADDARKTEEKAIVKAPWDEKMHSLKAQRKSRGEFFKCGDEFQPGHKCAKSVPLHMVEELFEILQLTSSDSEPEGSGHSSSEELHISQCALAGTMSRKSIRLQGIVNGKQVLILIDSGSCGSFVSNAAVQPLGLCQLVTNSFSSSWVR
jgi:hypothetical protein